MITKLLKLFFLLSLLLLILAAVLAQTPYVQKKFISWIETQTEGALTIEKLEGIIPFWIRLEGVRYKTNELDAQIDKGCLSFSPLPLLLGHLSILNIQAENITIKSQSDQWPQFPFPIRVHSLEIAHLNYNEYEDLALSGSADLKKDFSFQFTLSTPKFPKTQLRLNVDADGETKTLALVGHLKKNKDNIWISGEYIWDRAQFVGNLKGKGPDFKATSEIEFSLENQLTLPSFEVALNGHELSGKLCYDLKNKKLIANGSLLGSPFDLETNLTYLDKALFACNLIFSYAHNGLVGDLNYDFKTQNLNGALDLNAENFNVLNLAHSLEATAHAKLLFERNKILVTAEAGQIHWKDFMLPEALIQATWDQKQLNFELSFSQLSLLAPEYEVFPSLDFHISGSASPQQIQAKGDLQGFGEAPLTLQLELPILFSLNPLDVKINQEAPFTLDIKGKGSIDPLLRFLENALLIAKGTIDLDLNVSGTWEDPQLRGHLSYTDGHLESLTTGAVFCAIQMEMQASGRELLIHNLSAHDLEKGDLAGNGSISWNPKEGFPFALNLFTSRFLIMALDPFTASVSAEMQITGNIHEIEITGSADLVKAHLAIPNKMPVQVPTVEVSYINALVTTLPEPRNKKLIPIHWDIALNAPRNLIIDGRGLSSEWKGEMHISGEQNALAYAGKLKLVQGRFSVINRTFDLVDGKIRIEGTDAKNIHIDLRGDYELPTLTTSIVITGTLDNTHLSFCSSPPMSTNQILSWILFNQDINELSPLQACRLASLLVSLSGKYSGPKTFSAIKEGLGIDVFSITDCDIDSADLTFQVGKYISQGTFVGINKSISGDFDSVLIQTRLYRDFFLEADYGGSLNGFTPNGGKAIFKWYKSY